MKTLTTCILLAISSLLSAQMKKSTHSHAPHISPFVLSAQKLVTISAQALEEREAAQTKGAADGSVIRYDEADAHIVVRSGPPEDMLSYRIQGIRNPTIIIKPNAKIRILFVNVDSDMRHDIRFGTEHTPWSASPDTDRVGTRRLPPIQNNTYSAEEFILSATDTGTYAYFCSVRRHAAGGMAGRMIISNTPISLANIPKDTAHVVPHVHSANEEEETHEVHTETSTDHAGMDMGHDVKTNDMAAMDHGATKLPYQIASGTSWVPSATPMYALMYMYDHSHLMIHGGITPEYIYQSGPRGDKTFTAPNWFMLMYENTLGASDKIELRGMFSLDAVVAGNRGYPLLLQTGEGLVDRQHPHDLFDELAVSYTHDFSKDVSVNLYGGLPGEPALGPPAFMHRTSAMSNPNAPLGHHWQDATHITFGVATLGLRFDNFKIEGSVFTGKEPDSNRYGIDKPLFDSYSGRLSFNPTSELALQTSYGFLKNVEGDNENIHRLTLSAIYTTKIGEDGWWASTLVFGQNKTSDHATNSILLESQYTLGKNNIYGRAEFVQKPYHDLFIPGDAVADVSALTLGYSRTLGTLASIDFDLGAQATYNIIPKSLQSLYGSSPIGAQIYLAIHPTLHDMGGH